MATQAATTARRAPRTRRQFRCLDLPKVYSSYKITKDGQKIPIWIVDGREHDGSRYRLTRHSEAEAWALAREQQALNQQEFRLGTTLPMHVLVEAAETHRKGICIQEAVAFFEKNRPKTEQVLVKVATEAYVYDREKIQKCGAGVAQMKNMFKRFNAGFGNRFLHELSTKEIEQWLLAQQRPDGWKEFGPIGDERRNTILKLIRALFTFASGKARGWLPPDHNPAKDISLIKIVRMEPCTMSADETAQFLKLVPSFPKDVQAYAILRIFAPVRRCEFVGLDWSKLVSQNLRVLGKGKRRRTIPLEEVCMSGLRSLIKKSGPILERSLPKADDYLPIAGTPGPTIDYVHHDMPVEGMYAAALVILFKVKPTVENAINELVPARFEKQDDAALFALSLKLYGMAKFLEQVGKVQIELMDAWLDPTIVGRAGDQNVPRGENRNAGIYRDFYDLTFIVNSPEPLDSILRGFHAGTTYVEERRFLPTFAEFRRRCCHDELPSNQRARE